MAHAFTTTKKPGNALKAILFTALLAGTLDGFAAITVYQVSPSNIFKFIASGAFGSEVAYSGGGAMVFYGVLFHYIIAFSWTVFYFLIYRYLRTILSNKYIAGVLYGIFVWLMMNLLVLPLTKIPGGPIYWDKALVGATILIFMIGLPISILAHRFYSQRS
jgi:hypothetical protein